MGEVISKLKAKFGVDTTDFKKGLKDGEGALNDFKGAGKSSIEEFAAMFGINMGAVSDALDTTKKSLGFMGQAFKASATGSNTLAVALKVLKFALIATGIGAIVVALGSLVAYFTKSGEGADKFARILRQVKAVIGDVIERLAIFGKGMFEILTGKFKQGWEDMSSAFQGFGKEIVADVKAAGELEDAMDALEDREIALITVQDQRTRSIAELRAEAKELEFSEAERLKKLESAKGLIGAYYKDEISLAQERFNLKKKEIDLSTKDPTDEQRRELAELEGQINRLYAEQAIELKGLSREYNSLYKSVSAAAAAQVKSAEDSDKAIKDLAKNGGAKITLFDINDIKGQLAVVEEVATGVTTKIAIGLSGILNSAFEDMAAGIGEFLGNLASGKAGIKDFGTLVITALADMAIAVGKIAISTGITMAAIKSSLEFGSAYGAVLAGAALIALGTAVKSGLKNAAGGSGSASTVGSGSSGSSGYSFDTSGKVGQSKETIELQAEFVIKGKDLVAVVDHEIARKKRVT